MTDLSPQDIRYLITLVTDPNNDDEPDEELLTKLEAMLPPTLEQFVTDALVKWMDRQAEQEATRSSGIVDALHNARGNDVKIVTVSTDYSWQQIAAVAVQATNDWHRLHGEPPVNMADVEWLRRRLRSEEEHQQKAVQTACGPRKQEYKTKAESAALAFGKAADLVDDLQKRVLQR